MVNSIHKTNILAGGTKQKGEIWTDVDLLVDDHQTKNGIFSILCKTQPSTVEERVKHHCCCGFAHVETGTIIIGWFGLFATILALFGLCTTAAELVAMYCDPNCTIDFGSELLQTSVGQKAVILAIVSCGVYIMYHTVSLLSHIALLICVHKQSKGWLRPYLIWIAVGLFLHIVTTALELTIGLETIQEFHRIRVEDAHMNTEGQEMNGIYWLSSKFEQETAEYRFLTATWTIALVIKAALIMIPLWFASVVIKYERYLSEKQNCGKKRVAASINQF